MDQATHNKMVSSIRGIEDKLGARPHFAPGSWTHSANPGKR